MPYSTDASKKEVVFHVWDEFMLILDIAIMILPNDEKLLERHQTVQKKLQKGLTVREINEITGASSATIIKVKKVMTNRKML